MKAKGAKCEFFSFFKPILFGHGVNSKLSSQLVQFHAPCLIYNNVFDHIFSPQFFFPVVVYGIFKTFQLRMFSI